MGHHHGLHLTKMNASIFLAPPSRRLATGCKQVKHTLVACITMHACLVPFPHLPSHTLPILLPQFVQSSNISKVRQSLLANKCHPCPQRLQQQLLVSLATGGRCKRFAVLYLLYPGTPLLSSTLPIAKTLAFWLLLPHALTIAVVAL